MSEPIILKPIQYCTFDQQMAVLAIRNADDIRVHMYQDHVIGTNEHLSWLASLTKDATRQVFCPLRGEMPLGVVSLSAIDLTHGTADWAFYLGEGGRGGLGIALEAWVLGYAFETLGLAKLNCEILASNHAVIRRHSDFGFTEEGRRRANIAKDGARVDVVLMGMTASEWAAGKERILSPFEGVLGRFSLSVANEEESKWSQVLRRIEGARAKNNVNWMALLRLALESDNDKAMAIIEEIMRIDKDISGMTAELVETRGQP